MDETNSSKATDPTTTKPTPFNIATTVHNAKASTATGNARPEVVLNSSAQASRQNVEMGATGGLQLLAVATILVIAGVLGVIAWWIDKKQDQSRTESEEEVRIADSKPVPKESAKSEKSLKPRESVKVAECAENPVKHVLRKMKRQESESSDSSSDSSE